MQKAITVLIYTHNEEKNIIDCIMSAKLLSDNVILIDMESQDKTTQIAKEHNVTVYNFPYSQYVEPARKFGIEQAKTDWVLILDADERITQELAKEIDNVLNSNYKDQITNQVQNSNDKINDNNIENSHYKIPRKNIFAGKKWLKHGGWWPDQQIRLINKRFFVDWPTQIHSTPIIKGDRGFLQQPLLHFFHGDLETMVDKTINFENIESDLLLKANKPVATITFFRKFFGELFRRLIVKKGFMDGIIGIMESIYQAFSKTITYLLLYEKKNCRSL